MGIRAWAGCCLLCGSICRNCLGGQASLTGLQTSAPALEDVLQSLDYRSALHQQAFGELLQFMRSTFERENELRAKKKRVL